MRDATYVLDGLLYHESDLRIEEHYTDTSGFTDHVFAMMHLLGFRFAPRIRDLPDKRLFVPRRPSSYPAIKVLIGGTINAKRIRTQWDETLRLVTSIKHGTVTASLMLRKLSSYPRQNGLAVALREIGQNADIAMYRAKQLGKQPDVGLASIEIVRMIIALAQSLSLTVTAEGVETDEQHDSFARWGVRTLRDFCSPVRSTH